MKPLRPLNPETFPPEMRDIVRWHLLFNTVDQASGATGMGFADVWGLSKRGRYEDAKTRLSEHVERFEAVMKETHR